MKNHMNFWLSSQHIFKPLKVPEYTIADSPIPSKSIMATLLELRVTLFVRPRALNSAFSAPANHRPPFSEYVGQKQKKKKKA